MKQPNFTPEQIAFIRDLMSATGNDFHDGYHGDRAIEIWRLCYNAKPERNYPSDDCEYCSSVDTEVKR